MNRLFRIALLCAVCAGLVVLQASAADPVRKFEGTTTCGAMKVEVSFTYDFAAGKIRDFYSEHSCMKGGHAMAFEAKTIDVSRDGTFSYKEENGSSVEGRIDGSNATGAFGGFNCALRCADQQFHEPCQTWKASAQ